MNANKHESKAPCSIRVYLCLSVAVFLPVLTGCQSLGRTPAWVANPKAVYPESAYLVSVGAGDTRRAADYRLQPNILTASPFPPQQETPPQGFMGGGVSKVMLLASPEHTRTGLSFIGSICPLAGRVASFSILHPLLIR